MVGQQSNKSGVVSILTVVFVAILLSIVTIAFIRLALNEQRQASDDDLSTAAFYAAESGLEDAKRALGEYLDTSTSATLADLAGEDCNPSVIGNPSTELSSPSGLDIEYTCQLIDLSPDSLEVQIGVGDSKLLPIRAVDSSGSRVSVDNIVFRWHLEGEDGTGYNLRVNDDLLSVNDWNNAPAGPFPSMLRISMFGHQQGAITTADLNQYDTGFLLNPSSGVSPATTYGYLAQDSQIIPGVCDASASTGEYVCEAVLDLPSAIHTWDLYAKVRPLYTNTTVSIEARSGTDRQDLEGAQAAIDVTGRSGDVSRRVLTRVSLIQDSALPDYTVVGGDGICKNFKVTDDVADWNPSVVGSCLN